MTSQEIQRKEKSIGKQASKMAENFLHAIIRQRLASKNRNEGPSLIKTTKVAPKIGEHRLMGLNMTTSKVALIQHYGFVGVRQGGEVFFKAARYNIKNTTRSASQVNLPAQEIFEDFYNRSGAVDFLLENLKETRTEAIIAEIKNRILKLNKEDDG